MKIRAYLILIVIVLIAFISTRANTEESISLKDKAIELAKTSVYLTYDDGTEVTAQKYAEQCTKENHIFPIGWDAVDVSETMYLVVFKFIMGALQDEDKEAAWFFHVIPKDNIAQHLDELPAFEKFEERKIVKSDFSE